jgi:alkyl hydroperoxide reductase subunit AhpF
MSLLSDSDRQELTALFAGLTRPVRVVLFTQTFGCETCTDARRILDELAELTPKLTIEECNLVLDKDRAAAYGIDRAPAMAVVALDEDGTEHDYGVRFVGLTAGYEFSSLVDAVLLVSSGDSRLSESTRTLLAQVAEPVRIQVFVTPT